MKIRLLCLMLFWTYTTAVFAQINACNDAIEIATSYYAQGKYERALSALKACNKNDFKPNDKRRRLLTKLTCQAALEIGNQKFTDGQLQDIGPVLEGCDVESYDEQVQRKVLALLTEANVFLDNNEAADSNYLRMLKLDPFSEFDLVAPEMVYLANRFETFPLTSYSLNGTLFFSTRPIISQSFSLPEISKLAESYKLTGTDLYSWTASLLFDVNILNSNLYLRSGYGVTSYYYRYTGLYANALDENNIRGDATVTFQERTRWSQIPLLLKLTLVNRNTMIKRRLLPYIFGGIGFEFLHKGSARLLSPTITFSNPERAKSIPTVDNAGNRIDYNTTLILGGGAAWRFKRIYINAEITYHRQFQDIVDRSGINPESDLVNVLNYVDNDFKLHKFGVGVGIGFFLFKSQKIPGS